MKGQMRDLRDFIRLLEKAGELKHINNVEVSPELEITEIADRISKKGGPAIMFHNVTGSKYPVLINAFGSYRRMALALGAGKPEKAEKAVKVAKEIKAVKAVKAVSAEKAASSEKAEKVLKSGTAGPAALDKIAADIAWYLDQRNILSIKKIILNISRLFRLIYALPLRRRLFTAKAKCRQVVEKGADVNLYTLPVLKCWPQDAGRFFTLPLVFTKYPGTKQQNAGMYRMQILDRASTAMHWHKHKDGSGIYSAYAKKGIKMPVSVALGCDPAVIYAVTAPLPAMIDEMILAGWLRMSRVRMVKCLTNDIYVPADSEFILEGYVDPTEEHVLEGPFGDHTGYYSLADKYPVFHVTCITHRKDAIYPATVVGKPPMEDCYMAKATERLFLPFIRLQIPEIADINLPLEGVFHNCAIVSVHPRYPGVARKVMNAIWGMGQMMYTKMIVVVDEQVDVQDLSAVRDAVLENVSGSNDLVISEGPLDALDHSSERVLYGNRLGVDATAAAGNVSGYNKKGKSMVQNTVIGTYKVIAIRKERPFQGREAAQEFIKANNDKFIIVVDDNIDPEDISTVMWKVFNNIDAGRDIIITEGRICVDATRKWREEGAIRGWPDDIEMTSAMKEYVSARWKDYGIGEGDY